MSEGGSYDPQQVEPDINAFWEAGGYFTATADRDREPYTIVIPPPNVTGALHLGHAVNNTLQDVLIRSKRMQGYNACWLPGTDHAGIATQAIVEKRLKQDEGLTRHEIGRDGLVERIWAWKEEFGSRILEQLRRMGASCDWTRTRFTLDETCAEAVHATFFRMFCDGLVFRGRRLVNWDTHLQTAVADDEVFHEHVKSSLWHIRYPILGSDHSPDAIDAACGRASGEQAEPGRDYLMVATTRPETMLADVAVAVHPSDARYKGLIGRSVLLPLMNKPIPVIGDGVLVNPEFGTGCVKVTPGHDPNDYATGLRHDLPMLSMMDERGRVSELDGMPDNYVGLSMEAARKQIVGDLETIGLMDRIEPYETEVGHSDRSKTPIQPFLSEQWFVGMEQLAEMAMEAVRDGRVRFFPPRFARTYLDWLSEKRDWCVSRQLWWGHRIPVWTQTLEAATSVVLLGQLREVAALGSEVAAAFWMGSERWLVADDAAAARLVARLAEAEEPVTWRLCPRRPEATDSKLLVWMAENGFERDPDVLDTWFSSALWPFSTFGWPDARPDSDAAYFYPSNVLSTARDIISLWVARMVMTSSYLNGRVPFQHVMIHPTILDGRGARMSKTAGNGLDPLDLIEHFGTDAMRYVLAGLSGDTQDVRIAISYLCPHCGEGMAQKPKHLGKRLVSCEHCKREFATRLAKDEEVREHKLGLAYSDRFEDGRRFCNKLWQVANGFVLSNLGGYVPKARTADELKLEDRWILSRLHDCIAQCDRRLGRYQFSDLIAKLYSFFWNDFCDWYVELVKPRLFDRDADGQIVNRTDDGAVMAQQVLLTVLDQVLRLLHPVMPFITEALWKRLNQIAPERGVLRIFDARRSDEGIQQALCVTTWPSAADWPRDCAVEEELAHTQDVIRALRDVKAQVNQLRSQAGEKAIRNLPWAVVRADGLVAEQLRAHQRMLQRLGNCDAIEIGPDQAKPPQSASKVLPGAELYVPLDGLADPSIERERLGKERDEVQGHLKRLEGKLSNEKFVANAPVEVVATERERCARLQEKLAAIQRNLADLGA